MIIDLAVICPREVEFKEISKILTSSSSFTTSDRKVKFAYGQISGKHFLWNIAIVEPDFTNYSFALKTTQVINALGPDYLFLAGTAGGIKDVTLGDLVISTHACTYEFGKETAEGFKARANTIVNTNQELLTIARRLTRELETINPSLVNQPNYYFGLIASGDKVITSRDSDTYKIIASTYESTLAVEMEAFDFAQIAEECDLQYLNIRSVSDLIDNKFKADKTGSQIRASFRVKEFLDRLIPELPKPNEKPLLEKSIKFSDQPFTKAWRNSKPGKIRIFKKYIELNVLKSSWIIKALISSNHFKMPGDISKSWVNLKYLENGKEKELFVSNAKSPGIAAWFGGSEELFQALQLFRGRQIELI